jgi:hypothetical protein
VLSFRARTGDGVQIGRMAITVGPAFPAAVLLVGVACGARTGLDVPDAMPSDASVDAESHESGSTLDGAGKSGADGNASQGGVLCSLYAGPVDSCDAGGDVGPIQRCTPVFSLCTTNAIEFPAPQQNPNWWGCCVANPPGGHDNCVYVPIVCP